MKPYEVIVVGGSEYHLKLTTANAVRLEEELGTDVLNGLDRIIETRILAKYLFYAAKTNDSISTIEDIYTLIDDYVIDGKEIADLRNMIPDILLTSGILTQEAYDMNKQFGESQKKMLQEAYQKSLNGNISKPSNGE